MLDIDISRRSFFKTLAATAIGSIPIWATSGDHAPTERAQLDPHRLLLPLRYGARDATTYWWMTGRRYAAIDQELIPLFNLWVGFAYRRSTLDQHADQIEIRSRVLYTELETDELLSRWQNPISGKSVNFSFTDPKTEIHRFDFSKGLERLRPEPIRQKRRDEITAIRFVGGKIFLDESSNVEIFPSDNTRIASRKIHDRYTWSGPSTISNDPRQQFFPGEVSFMDVTDWSPKLEMGSIPGRAIAHCTGVKCPSIATFPATWHQLHQRYRLTSLAFADNSEP
jgi:hypothetical protein